MEREIEREETEQNPNQLYNLMMVAHTAVQIVTFQTHTQRACHTQSDLS